MEAENTEPARRKSGKRQPWREGDEGERVLPRAAPHNRAEHKPGSIKREVRLGVPRQWGAVGGFCSRGKRDRRSWGLRREDQQRFSREVPTDELHRAALSPAWGGGGEQMAGTLRRFPPGAAGETVNVEMLFFFSSQETQGGQMSGQGPRIGDKGGSLVNIK